MKTNLISIYLLVLFAAFSCTEPDSDMQLAENTAIEDSTESKSVESSIRIAFIYGDTLNEKYEFLKEAQSELDQEEKVIQERLDRKLRKAQSRAAELQQQAPSMTQMQMQEAQLELQNLDIEIQQFQEKLTTDFRKREAQLQKEYIQRVDSFLDEFNADGRYDFIMNYQQGGNLIWVNNAYDITDEVLKGLNDSYAREMSVEKAKQP